MAKAILAALILFAVYQLFLKPRPKPRQPRMPEDEARAVLGVRADADAEAIRAAHRRLVSAVHPDKGGSAELTRRINAARDGPMPGTSRRMRSASIRPEVTPRGRSIWVVSPVTAIRLPSPRRVRNIFICMGEVFCAYLERPTEMGQGARRRVEQLGLHRAVCDYVASMTDRYVIQEHQRLFGLKVARRGPFQME